MSEPDVTMLGLLSKSLKLINSIQYMRTINLRTDCISNVESLLACCIVTVCKFYPIKLYTKQRGGHGGSVVKLWTPE